MFLPRVYLKSCKKPAWALKKLGIKLFFLAKLTYSIHSRWVPIKGNDWYWIRQHIKVGMHVIVEIVVSDQLFLFCYFFIAICSLTNRGAIHLAWLANCSWPSSVHWNGIIFLMSGISRFLSLLQNLHNNRLPLLSILSTTSSIKILLLLFVYSFLGTGYWLALKL